MGSNPTASAILRGHARLVRAGVALVFVGLSACVSIPGETLAPSGLQGEIRDRIYAHGRGVAPECRQQKIAHTEVLELHPEGKVAEERWTLENCGRKLIYVVSFPRKPSGLRFQVRP
ncbi:MAG: hypothetical protein ACXW20_18870, partial [Burkholderiales bacterium]